MEGAESCGIKLVDRPGQWHEAGCLIQMFVQVGETQSSSANGGFRAMGREKSKFQYDTEEDENKGSGRKVRSYDRTEENFVRMWG